FKPLGCSEYFECIKLSVFFDGNTARIRLDEVSSIEDLKHGLWKELDINTINTNKVQISKEMYPDGDKVKVMFKDNEYLQLDSILYRDITVYNPVENTYVPIFKPKLKIKYVKEVL
ncbi:MAG: hypothetical protein J7L07_02790, partial [Candidatus Odinarchaeota archaeon]|nr:hypothetical protein [Candidatus Odinarchaeota archaeon]